MIEVVVYVTSDVAPRLHTGSQSTALEHAVEQMGFRLKPVHPNVSEPNLMAQFAIEAPDEAQAKNIVDALLPRPDVEGAYIKPAAELP